MNYELVFSLVGLLAMLGWLLLLASPWMPIWSDRIAGAVLPAFLSAGYLAIIILFPEESGGFGSFADVFEMFSYPGAVMSGWLHFLAFDLLIGAWICRKARAENIRFWFVVPCLPVTFMLGPVGFLMFSTIRLGHFALQRRAAN